MANHSIKGLPHLWRQIFRLAAVESEVEQRGQCAELERKRPLGPCTVNGHAIGFFRLARAAEFSENVSTRAVYLGHHRPDVAGLRAELSFAAHDQSFLRAAG